jgi:BirA family biotin operon repressor/biotin-[acetyl-CoA-carboxylase] ligase
MDFGEFLREVRRLRPPRQDAGTENLIVLKSVGSTNTLARAIVAEYGKECDPPPPVLLLAWEQTGGRGRAGRSWESPGGRGVYASLAFPVENPEALATLPLLVGVGLCRALDRYLPGRSGLKWPNDVLVGGRKIGGVLIEAQVQPGQPAAAVAGFGINYDQEAGELPAARGGATSLRLEGGAQGVSLAELAWALVAAVERELAHAGDAAYAVESYRERSVHREGDRLACRVGEETVEGAFRGFDEQGMLLLDSGGRRVRVSAGDVIEGKREASKE